MAQNIRTNFWPRLTAMITDLSFIYGTAFILFNFLQLIPVYISIAKLILIISILYFSAVTIKFRTTIGKALCGISVESKSKLNYTIAILLRELVYKQLFCIVPLYILISYFKLGWLSPYFEIFYCFILTLILFVFFLFRKRTWYDRWANTASIKNNEYDKVLARYGIILLSSIFLAIIGIRGFYYLTTNTFNDPFIPKHSKNAISPYVSFLMKQPDAKDYIFRLFEKNDIVILCERDHPEMTQYEFIFDLISDKRFIDNVGNVFTEIGSRTQQSNLDTLMISDGLSDEELELKLCHILQNYSQYPIWENTNYFDYYKKIYALNQELPKEKRIKHTFTDIECNWEKIKSKRDYNEEVTPDLMVRDELLANKVIECYERMKASDQEPEKCLVIMNYRHAFGPANVRIGDPSCASYIMKKYPDKCANVLINTVSTGFGLSNPGLPMFLPLQKAPVKNGIWDNSFEEIANKSLGFDFKDSPFGRDEFDLFLLPAGKLLSYQDVFTGFVLYKPLDEHYSSSGFKNIISNGFDNVILNRASITDDGSLDPDKNINSVKEKVEKLRKHEISIDSNPYRKYSSVIDVLFGTILLILGLVSGLINYFGIH